MEIAGAVSAIIAQDPPAFLAGVEVAPPGFLNFTLAGGEIVSPTPLFIGAQPAEVAHGHSMVLRPCAEEEDAARELLGSLDADRRREAIICETAPPDCDSDFLIWALRRLTDSWEPPLLFIFSFMLFLVLLELFV